METKSIPKDEKIVVVDTKLERWFKTIATLIIGMAGMFGYQKMPTINEGTKISEAVQTVKNLNQDELAALNGMQAIALEKQMKQFNDQQLIAMEKLETNIKSSLKEYDERTTKRLDKHGELILNNIKSIARIEALVPKARATNN